MHQIVNFARDTLGVTLYPGQAAVLSDYYTCGVQNWLLLAGRRSGKSLLSDIMAAYEAVIPDFEGMTREEEDRYILLVSVRQDSAQLHIRNIAKLLRHRKEIGKMIRRQAEDRLELSNGVVILSLPASARAARGYTASTLILDEAAFFVDTMGNSSAEAIYTALEPTTATFGDNARIIITTSVGAKQGLVYDLYDRSTQGDLDGWYITKAPTTSLNPKVSEKTIQNALKRDQEGAEAEYYCEFRERTEAFLSSEAIDQCIDRELHLFQKKQKVDSYLMAIDPALMRDHYGFAIGHLADGVTMIDYVKALHPPVNANDAEDLLQSLADRYKPSGVLCDNPSTVQRLKEKIPALKYTPFTRPQKLRIYGALKESINLGTILLPNDAELIDELKSLQIRNGVDIAAPKSGRVTHDDLADCVALIVDGLQSGDYSSGPYFPVLPNPMDWGGDYAGTKFPDDFVTHVTNGVGSWVYAPGKNTKPHPEGVTWHNCRHRTRGCQTCADEMDADPEYLAWMDFENQQAEQRARLTEGMTQEEVDAMDEFELMERLKSNGTIDRWEREDEAAEKRAQTLNRFWERVKGQ